MYANYMYLSDECLVDLMKFTSDEVSKMYRIDSLKQLLMDLVTHFHTEKIIEVDINTFDDKTIYESVKLLKEIFKNKYPKTKLKPIF